MSFIDILAAASGTPVAVILAFFNSVKEKAPDLAPAVDKFLSDLGSGVSADSIQRTLSVLPAEILDILRGELNPKDHPSDGI